MKMRPFDEYGDYKPVQYSSQMLEGTDAVAAATQSRVGMLYGEWWEDKTLGFEVPEFLIEGLRDGSTVQALVGYITAYLMETPEVESLVSSDYDVEGRELTADIVLSTTYGEELEWSVDVNELLSTLP